MRELDKDTQSYLDRIRKTIADTDAIIAQTELRMAETDRMLERQGLTREQVMAFKFSDAQLEAANEELKRRGFDPLERWERGEWDGPSEKPVSPQDHAVESGTSDAELENRQRKFGMMMKPFQI